MPNFHEELRIRRKSFFVRNGPWRKRCRRGTGISAWRRLEGPGKQFVDAAVGMAGGDGFECGLEPGVGLDAV